MIMNGEPFVPPTCPAEREGEPFDLTADNFVLYQTPDSGIGEELTEKSTYITGMFLRDKPGAASFDIVGAGFTELDEGSKFPVVMGSLGSKTVSKRAGELICHRIATCRGITEDGECWALDGKAVSKIVEQIVAENTLEIDDLS